MNADPHRRSPSPGSVAVALLAMALFAFVACARKPLQVVYYYKVGSPGLQERLDAVAALEKEFPGRVTSRSVDAGTPEAQSDLAHLDIGTAGLVVRNSNSIMVFKQGESFLSLPQVRAAIRKALGEPPAA